MNKEKKSKPEPPLTFGDLFLREWHKRFQYPPKNSKNAEQSKKNKPLKKPA